MQVWLKKMLLAVVILSTVITLAGCLSRPPSEESLILAFSEYIAQQSLVRDIFRQGNTIAFTIKWTTGTTKRYKVVITNIIIKKVEGAKMRPYAGIVESEVYDKDGKKLTYDVAPTYLFWNLQIGTCGAVWDKETRQWLVGR